MNIRLAIVTLIFLSAAALYEARQQMAVVTVSGTSMQPGLQPGDRVLIRRRPLRRLRRGSIVIFQEPHPAGGWKHLRPARTGIRGKQWVIKRIAALPGDPVPETVKPALNGTNTVPDGHIVALGDAAFSRDSRHWGLIPADQMLGQVLLRLSTVKCPQVGRGPDDEQDLLADLPADAADRSARA